MGKRKGIQKGENSQQNERSKPGQNDEQSCLYIMMTHAIKGHTEAVIPTEQLDKFEKKKKTFFSLRI